MSRSLHCSGLGTIDRTAVSFAPFLDIKFVSMNQPEAQDSREDQKDRYDVIEQLRHDQDEDAREQRDDRLKVCDAYGAYGHCFIPCIVGFTYQ
jgi:hypothetical protein